MEEGDRQRLLRHRIGGRVLGDGSRGNFRWAALTFKDSSLERSD